MAVRRSNMANKDMIRTFICLEIPKKVQAEIENKVTAPLRATGAGCSWVKADNLHLTLKFLGDVPETMLADIFESVKNSAGHFDRFHANLEKVGTFGGKIPRVVWVGIGGDVEKITQLANEIDKDLSKLGFERESRPFSPHLTVGRVRNPKNISSMLEKIDEISLPTDKFIIYKVIVMKSVLSPGGSVYTPQFEFELK